jgi:hypothetical protein
MDAEAKKRIDELEARLLAQAKQNEQLTAQLTGLIQMGAMKDDAARAAAEEIAAKKARVREIRLAAIRLSGEAEPAVLKYRIGGVMHYRAGTMYQPGDIIALPNNDLPRNQPSFTWSAFDANAARAADPIAVLEQKALSQLAKEQAPKPLGPLAAKKAARPSDAEV